jgi:hypothetical protein
MVAQGQTHPHISAILDLHGVQRVHSTLSFDEIPFSLSNMGSYKRIARSVFEIEEPAKHAPSRWRSWRVTVVTGALIATAVLFINVSLLAWTLRKEIEDGIVTIYQGKPRSAALQSRLD